MRRYLFADEAGDFEFLKKPNVSKYFIISAVSLDSCSCGDALLDLRRRLIWEGQKIGPYFHASEDRQSIRNGVFNLIKSTDLRIYATIMEKSKAQPQTRISRERFYHYGWFYLLKFAANKIVGQDAELIVTTASLGSKKEQAAFTQAVNDVLQQTLPRHQWVTSFCPAQADPCLQIADYCTWAIQRRWESQGKDVRSYDLIKDKIAYEYDLFSRGAKHYY